MVGSFLQGPQNKVTPPILGNHMGTPRRPLLYMCPLLSALIEALFFLSPQTHLNPGKDPFKSMSPRKPKPERLNFRFKSQARNLKTLKP